MKKLLLSALVLGLGLSVNAQTEVPGLGKTGAWDDFVSETEYQNEASAGQFNVDKSGAIAYTGLYWWQDNDAATPFASTNTRSGNKLNYTISQAAGAYEPFGVGFGQFVTTATGTDTTDFTVDLSKNAVVSFKINNSGTSDIEVKVQIQDANGIALAFDKAVKTGKLGDDDLANLYKYEIGATQSGTYGAGSKGKVLAGESLNFSYDFMNAVSAEFVLNPSSEFGCKNTPKYVCTDGTCFDYTKVKALTITVVNATGLTPAADNCYGKVALTDYPVSLENVVIGTKPTGTGLFDFSSKNAFDVTPNPASTTVSFGKRLTNVAVYNAQGILVETLATASELNVSSYKAGVYFINAAEGTARVLVK